MQQFTFLLKRRSAVDALARDLLRVSQEAHQTHSFTASLFIFLWVRRVERGEGGRGEGEKSERGEEKKGGKSQKRGEKGRKRGERSKKGGKRKGGGRKRREKGGKMLNFETILADPKGERGEGGEILGSRHRGGGIERGENPPAAEGGRKKSTMFQPPSTDLKYIIVW